MPELLYIGLDTLHLTAFAPVSSDIISQLSEFKALAAQGKDGFCVADLGWGPVSVDARGLRHYAYCFRDTMGTYFISAGQSPHFPQIKLCYGSLVCHQHSVADLLYHAKHMAMLLTGRILELKINRVDICADWSLPITDLHVLTADYFLFTGECDFSPHYVGPLYTGWHVSNSEVMFRCYDKLQEIKRNRERQQYYQTLYVGHQAVTRFELQLRGGYVRRYDLTVHNLADLYRQVYASMCTTWLCLYDRPIARDGHNSKRRQVRHLHPLWLLQQQVAETIPRKKKKEFAVQDEQQRIENRRRYHLQRALATCYSGVFAPPPLEVIEDQLEADFAYAYTENYRRLYAAFHDAFRRLEEEYIRCKAESHPDPARLYKAATVKMVPF
jgi:hypothetical protein